MAVTAPMSYTIQLTMINNATWYVDTNEFTLAGIQQDPVSLIGSYLRGSNKSTIHVWSAAGNSGTEAYVNPAQIVSFVVTRTYS